MSQAQPLQQVISCSDDGKFSILDSDLNLLHMESIEQKCENPITSLLYMESQSRLLLGTTTSLFELNLNNFQQKKILDGIYTTSLAKFEMKEQVVLISRLEVIDHNEYKGSIIFLDLENNKPISHQIHDASINQILSINNVIISCSNDCSLKVWLVNEELGVELLNCINEEYWITSIVELPSSNRDEELVFAYSTSGGVIKIISFDSENNLHELYQISDLESIYQLQFIDNMIWALFYDQQLRMFNQELEMIQEIECDGKFLCRNDNLLVTGNEEGDISIWNQEPFERMKSKNVHQASINQIVIITKR